MTDRPQRIQHAKTYGNFKKPLRERIAEKGNSNWREERPGMSEDHCALIRQMPCCVCMAVPAGQIHHLKLGTGERGLSVRSSDRWGVSLCLEDHDAVERAGTRNEQRWFSDRGIADPIELAAALWSNTGDLPKMIAVLIAHRGEKHD